MSRDLLREYMCFLRVEKGLATNSLQSYQRDLRKLEQWAALLDKSLMELKRGEIAAWAQHLGSIGLHARTVARAISSIRGFYLYLLRDGMIDSDPTAQLNSPQIPNTLPKLLSESEIDLLLKTPDVNTSVGIRDRAILEMFYATGLRVSELAGLKCQNINSERGIVDCRGKGGKQRLVPLGRSALEWLGKYGQSREELLRGKTSARLFIREDGKQLSRQFLWRIIKAYAIKASLPHVYPHMLRHSFATHLMQHGADSRSVQSFLGHSDLNTTQVYTHLTNNHLQATHTAHHPRAKKN